MQVLHASPGAYLQQRKHLVALVLHYAAALRVAQEVAHSSVRPSPLQSLFHSHCSVITTLATCFRSRLLRACQAKLCRGNVIVVRE